MDEQDIPGYYLSGHYLPHNVVLHILSYVHANDLLCCALVCKSWNVIVKTHEIWFEKYRRKYNSEPKNLPWYIYYALFGTHFFSDNLLKNNCGQDSIKHWQVLSNGGDGMIMEDPPEGCPPLPAGETEFNGRTCCFASSFSSCSKFQKFDIGQSSRLMTQILTIYKPHIYVSEWICPRFNCGSFYNLHLKLGVAHKPDYVADHTVRKMYKQFTDPQWEKMEIGIDDYENITQIVFEHNAKDTQFWRGNYGAKTAGAVLRISFDSIQPLVPME